MKRALFVALIVSAVTAAAAFAGESATTGSGLQARHIDDPAAALPTLSRFQTPGIAPNIGCGDPTSGEPCIDDGGGGGYTAGECNCSRICYEGHSSCNLSVSNNGCKAGSNGSLCSSCSGKCY